jgi:AcrR family transcriptional regulator
MTERGRRTRASIIDAAATLMYQRGVTATSLDDVLAAAGSGKSQLYHYFTDKADLVAAVIDRQLELVLAAQPALARANSWSGIDAWAAQILEAHTAPGGPFACPLGTIAIELKNDESFRPQLEGRSRSAGRRCDRRTAGRHVAGTRARRRFGPPRHPDQCGSTTAGLGDIGHDGQGRAPQTRQLSSLTAQEFTPGPGRRFPVSIPLGTFRVSRTAGRHRRPVIVDPLEATLLLRLAQKAARRAMSDAS